jgi:hypothetical protein
MRLLIIGIVGCLLVSSNSKTPRYHQPIITLLPKPIIELKIEKEIPTLLTIPERDVSDLIEAMILVESEGNPNAFAKGENAAGILQIRPIMVNEVNRLLHKTKSDEFYTLDDRWDEAKSIEMFYVIYNYYHKESTYEKIARCWNGGPKGLQKKQTKRYWKKIQKRLKANEDSVNRGREV